MATNPNRPILSFYGAKWRMARHYPKPEGIVIEPFAGSAGYSVWWGVEQALLIERDPVIAGIWSYLFRASREEILSLPLLQEGEKISDLSIIQEAKWLIGFWCNGGTSSPRNVLSQWGKLHLQQNQANVWGIKKREQIACQVDKMRGWHITQGSYEIASRVLSKATWFIDPPYQNAAGSHYRYSDIDFEALSRFAKTRAGLTIVCENEGATWLPFKTLGSFRGAAGKYRSGRTKEVVWVQEQ